MRRTHRPSPPSLRRILLADSAVCALSGLTLAAFAHPLAAAFVEPGPAQGFDLAGLLRVVGGTVALIGLGVFLTAHGRPIRAAAVWTILGIEVLWIAASLALLVLAAGALTPVGASLIGLGALLVGLFLWLEAWAFHIGRARPNRKGWTTSGTAR